MDKELSNDRWWIINSVLISLIIFLVLMDEILIDANHQYLSEKVTSFSQILRQVGITFSPK